MINNKQNLQEYLETDRIANKKERKHPKFGGDITWRFLISLRKLEYHLNCNHSFLRKPIVLFRKAIWYYYSVKTSITIHPNCFDKGLVIYHYGTIIVNGSVKAGQYCTVQPGNVISANVILGDNVYLAPGVKINKNLSIASNTTVGFNSVITKDIKDDGGIWVGMPAVRIR